MEHLAIKTLAEKLGISSQSVIRKAEEYMRLAEIRGSSSIFAAQGSSGSCKAALCLELAAINCGQSVNRESNIRLSGLNKKIYSSYLKSMETLLDLESKTTIPDLAVQFSATNEAKLLAVQVLRMYEAELGDDDSATHSKTLFNTAALYTACRKLKVKIDKNKVTSIAGVKKTLFDKLVGHMDKYADKIIAETKKSSKTNVRSKTFLEELEDMPDMQDGNKKAKVDEGEEENVEDDYEDWKHRILENAHKALGKTYKRN